LVTAFFLRLRFASAVVHISSREIQALDRFSVAWNDWRGVGTPAASAPARLYQL